MTTAILFAAALTLVAPKPPFAGDAKAVPAQTEMTDSGFACGSKRMFWDNAYKNLHLTNCGRVLFDFETYHSPLFNNEWRPFENYSNVVDRAARRVTRYAFFNTPSGHTNAWFSQTYQLQDDGKIRITFDYSPDITPAERGLTLRMSFPRGTLDGKSVVMTDAAGKTSRFAYGSGDNWVSGGKSVLNCTKFTVDPENAWNAYTVEFAEPQPRVHLYTTDKGGYFLPLFKFPPKGPLVFTLDLGKTALAESQDCVVEGINFTANNGYEMPVYDTKRNFLMNPSFESGRRYWQNPQQHDRNFVTDVDAHSGRFSFCPTNATWDFSFCRPIFANRDYTVSCWARSVTGKKEKISLQILTYSSVPNCRTELAIEAGPEWRRFEKTVKFDARSLNISAVGQGKVLLDDLQLEPGSKATAYAGNPFGLEILTDSPDGTMCAYGQPIRARLVVRGPVGSKGTIDYRLTDFFGRERAKKTVAFAIDRDLGRGSGEAIIPFEDALFLKGVNLLRCDVRPAAGAWAKDLNVRPFTDFLRLNLMTYQQGDKKLRSIFSPGATGPWVCIGNTDESYYDYIKHHGFGSFSYHPGGGDDEAYQRKLATYGITDYGCQMLSWSCFSRKLWIGGQEVVIPEDKDPVWNLVDYPESLYRIAESNAYEYAKRLPSVNYFNVHTEPFFWFRCLREQKPSAYGKLHAAMCRGMKRANPKARLNTCGTCSSGHAARKQVIDLMKVCRDEGCIVETADIHIYRDFPERPDLDTDIQGFEDELDEAGFKDCPINFGEGTYYYPLIVKEWLGIAPWEGVGAKDRFFLQRVPSYDMGWGEILSAVCTVRNFLQVLKHSARVRMSCCWQPLEIDSDLSYAWGPAMAVVSDLLGDSSFVKDIRFAPDSRAYVFDDGHGRTVAAVWKGDETEDRGKRGPDKITFTLANAEIFDMMGNEVERVGGGGELPLGMCPFYVRVPNARRDELIKAVSDAQVEGAGLMPLEVMVNVVSLEKAEVSLINPLTRTVRTAVAIGDGAPEAVEVAPRATVVREYRFPEKLQIGAFRDVTVPVSMKVGEKTETTVFRTNILPIPYAEKMPDWDRLRADPISSFRPCEPIKLGRAKHAGPKDHSARMRAAWNEGHLYVRFDVEDDKFFVYHEDTKRPHQWYDNDAIQFFFDALGDGRDNARRGIVGLDRNDYGYELLPNTNGVGAVVFRREAPDHQLTGGIMEGGLLPEKIEPGVKIDFFRKGTCSTYVVDFPQRYLLPATLDPKSHPAFGAMIFDRDDASMPFAKSYLTNMNTSYGAPGHRPQYYTQFLFVK